jgi:hypothetical protein
MQKLHLGKTTGDIMTVFRVFYNVHRTAWKDIDTSTLEKAKRMAEASDGMDFNVSSEVDWTLDDQCTNEYNENEVVQSKLYNRRTR